MATWSEKWCKEVFEKAHEAGIEAGNAVNETPMIVGEVNPATGQTKPSGGKWVAPGICGFASVNIKPANCKFARWLVENGLARKSSYYGGVMYHVHQYNQSYERKSAYAYAFANVLREAGLKKVWVHTRLD